jgi:hypothetical protein
VSAAAKEGAGGRDVAARRDVHVDHLAMLVHRPVHVPPDAADLHVRLVDEPAATHRMPARSGRVDHEWCEVLHSPVQADVVHLDPAFSQESSRSR